MACLQPLLLHVNGGATCAVHGTLDDRALRKALREHARVVPCRVVLGTGCPQCRPGADPAGLPTGSPDWSLDECERPLVAMEPSPVEPSASSSTKAEPAPSRAHAFSAANTGPASSGRHTTRSGSQGSGSS